MLADKAGCTGDKNPHSVDVSRAPKPRSRSDMTAG
ncbi:uncharacterized protein METZ01_LOCUS318628, partial [marine metagenome]